MGAACASPENNKSLKKQGEKPKIPKKQPLIHIDQKILITEYKTNLEDDYKMLKFIGEGSFAKVYQVQNRLTGNYRAMKSLKRKTDKNPNGNLETTILNEIDILIKLDHPNILKLYSFYTNENTYDLITEYCPYGSLYDEVDKNGPLSEKQTAYILYQILSAINYCHKMNIIHRDLKPENILIINREEEDNELFFVKICDFGTAKLLEEGKIEKQFVGSSYYIAPEVLLEKYNEKCDLWSIGVIMYVLLTGKPPFPGKNNDEIYQHIKEGRYDLKNNLWNNHSEESKDLIYNLLLKDINKRFSAEKALNHNWFVKYKSKEIFNKFENQIIIDRLINNLINYKSISHIQECALSYLVHNFNQTRNVINACKLFNLIDTDHDGKINENDLYEGLKISIKKDNLENICHEIFTNIDLNNKTYVEYEEFVRGAVEKDKFLDDYVLKFAFRFFDKDGNVEVDYREIEETFKQNIVDKNKLHECLKKIIDEVDSDKDGKISYYEFCNAMKKMIYS